MAIFHSIISAKIYLRLMFIVQPFKLGLGTRHKNENKKDMCLNTVACPCKTHFIENGEGICALRSYQ